ncbi:MAG: PTS fructose transporter subunit IIB [Solobacterium sp.]|nr:PTS fructose transporter subunit IIB [Solobacterium sp.]
MKVVGITSCTVGIAHTYMAREKLIETGKKLGFDVKVETQGSGGTEYDLTAEDIANADVVLIASDVTVSGTERFKGKPLVKVPVSTAIKSPEGLLKQIQAKLNK